MTKSISFRDIHTAEMIALFGEEPATESWQNRVCIIPVGADRITNKTDTPHIYEVDSQVFVLYPGESADLIDGLYEKTTTQKVKKVEKAAIDALMGSLKFRVHTFADTTTTIAVAFLPNGFSVGFGKSACIDPKTFDLETGTRLAIEDATADARKRLWELEGYRVAA